MTFTYMDMLLHNYWWRGNLQRDEKVEDMATSTGPSQINASIEKNDNGIMVYDYEGAICRAKSNLKSPAIKDAVNAIYNIDGIDLSTPHGNSGKISMVQHMASCDKKNNFHCTTCNCKHSFIELPVRKIIVGDSLLTIDHGGEDLPYDSTHFDYLVAPEEEMDVLTRSYFDLYKWTPETQVVYVLGAMNDVLHFKTFEQIVESYTKFDEMLNLLDRIHGRTGNARSRVVFCTLPWSPSLVPVPREGIYSTRPNWCTPRGKVIIDINYWLESVNEASHPGKVWPQAHNLGWRSSKKNKTSSERKYSKRRDAWRPNEEEEIHYSSQYIGNIIRDAQKFLNSLEAEILASREVTAKRARPSLPDDNQNLEPARVVRIIDDAELEDTSSSDIKVNIQNQVVRMLPLPQLEGGLATDDISVAINRGLATDDISVAINLSADNTFEAGNSDYELILEPDTNDLEI